MILYDKTIKNYIETGKITILPEFDMKNIRPAGIRLHLGGDLLIPMEGQTVDLNTADDLRFERIDTVKKT